MLTDHSKYLRDPGNWSQTEPEEELEEEELEMEDEAKINPFVDEKSRAEELADAHWDYIEQVLETAGYVAEQLDEIGFHYRTAMVHGYKHGVEDAINKAKGE